MTKSTWNFRRMKTHAVSSAHRLIARRYPTRNQQLAKFFCRFGPEIACQAPKPLNSLKTARIEFAGNFSPFAILKTVKSEKAAHHAAFRFHKNQDFTTQVHSYVPSSEDFAQKPGGGGQ